VVGRLVRRRISTDQGTLPHRPAPRQQQRLPPRQRRHLPGNLACAEPEDHVSAVFDHYFGLLDDEKVMVARFLARNAGKIALAHPDLRGKIANRLLEIDATRHTQGREDLIKGDIVGSFSEHFEQSDQTAEMVRFAEPQLDCSIPRARRAAREFLTKHSM
jgi:hypothetical protein